VGSTFHGISCDCCGPLSDDQLVDLGAEIDRTLCAILKIDSVKPTLPIEQKIAETITKAWKAAARKGLVAPLKRVLSGKATESKINTFVKALGLKLANPLTKRQIKLLTSRLKKIYQIAKDIGAKEAKVAGLRFNLADQKAVRAVAKHQVFWVGDFYTTHLSERIRAVSSDILIKQGLGRVEAGKVLGEALKREFGLIPGGRSPFAPNVPAAFAGRPDDYFKGVASTASHQSRTFGKISAYNEVGITSYKLVNPNDKRTGKICQQMNGQVFSVQTGVAQMNSIIEAEKPEDVKEVAPWLSAKQIRETVGNAKPGSQDATDRLSAAGAVLPPFHMLCRTEVVVLRG
jgi:hypothetical protein